MDASILAAYIAACAALTFMPGPDIAFVISESLAKGRRTGYVLSCGLCSGVLVHTFLCASGIALAIAASPALFSSIRVAGAAYLLWLARGAFLEDVPEESASADFREAGFRRSGGRIFLRGFLMNVSNPKVIIFFLSFLPQFLTEGGWPVWIQMSVLGLVFMFSALPILICVASLAAAFARLFKSRKFRLAMKWLRVCVFALIGLCMLAETAADFLPPPA